MRLPRQRPSLVPTEFVAIATLLWTAFALALPGDTFARARAWRAMAQLAPEEVWATASGLVGLCMVAGLFLPVLWRIRAHNLAVLLLLFYAGGFAYANWQSAAPGTYAAIAVGLAWVRVPFAAWKERGDEQ